MNRSTIRSIALGTVLITSIFSGVGLGEADENTPRTPRISLLDRFDDEQSPLQKGLLDARDKRWRKNLKLSSDPRCSQLIRIWAKNPTADLSDQRIGRLCGGLGQDACLDQYCGEENHACAKALIDGTDLSVCSDTSGQSTAAESTCAEMIFVPEKTGQSGKAVECLEDPFRKNCPASEPDCELELKPKCKRVFETCDEMAFLRRAEKKTSQSGLIKEGARVVGRRLQTSTVIHYDDKKQRTKGGSQGPPQGGWDPLRIRGSALESALRGVPGAPLPPSSEELAALARTRALGASAFNNNCDPMTLCPENDDDDCYDAATGEHLSGSGCFVSTDDGSPLRQTMVFVTDCNLGDDVEGAGEAAVCCKHMATGRRFFGDDCLIDPSLEPEELTADANLRTSLVQLVDEDPCDDARNNDGDCADQAGNITSDCLDAGGNLRTGFDWNVDEEICGDDINNDGDCLASDGIGRLDGTRCVGVDGSSIGEEEGVDFVQLVDEDCADRIDDDGDGPSGEDPPGIRQEACSEDGGAADPNAPGVMPSELLVRSLERDQQGCRDFYMSLGLEPDAEELPDAERGCDLTRAMRVKLNSELGDISATTGNKRKLFDVDGQGRWCGDPGAQECSSQSTMQGVVNPVNVHSPRERKPNRSYAYEERQVTLDEVFGVKCRPIKDGGVWVNTFYDDATGNCVAQGQDPSTFRLAAFGASADGCAAEQCHDAMMGFTFAPPVIEWGYRVQEEACVFGLCVEIFSARIGYEFDLAAGIRLPVEIQFDDVPESALAEAPFTIRTSLQPLDFSVDEFRAFCDLHDLDSPWYIADCDRFAFPDFLDSNDGDELVAAFSIFAGVQVKVLEVPLINWAVDSAVDVPAMCTASNLKNGVEGMNLQDIVKLELGLLDDQSLEEVLGTLKDNFGNCGSFTTPFGFEECPEVDGQPDCPDSRRIRQWPFLSGSYSIRADCLDALRHDETYTFNKKRRPRCTGLVLGTHGASLGVGLTLEASAGSLQITTDWSASGDASDSNQLTYTRSADDPQNVAQLIAVTPDNWDDSPTEDNAKILLDDFTYYLDTIEIAVKADLQFGGILEPIPDIGSFDVYSFAFSTGTIGVPGIPIPQHPGTHPAIELEVPVENYALQTDVQPDTPVEVQPGCRLAVSGDGQACVDYEVWITNLGSRVDSFNQFEYRLSNRQRVDGCDDQIEIDRNNDHDCYVSGEHRRGNPFDGEPDDCYDECGRIKAGATEIENEDPPGCPAARACDTPAQRDDDGDGLVDEDPADDDWSAAWIQRGQNTDAPTILSVDPHSQATEPVLLRVSPLQHSFTSPGVYPFRVTADSVGAVDNGLDAEDASGNRRLQAPDVGLLEVRTFFDPRLQIRPEEASVAPGGAQSYTLEVTNGGNADDAAEAATGFLDFNQRVPPCSLADLGGDPACPFRAVPTVIPAEWLVDQPPGRFPETEGQLMTPLQYLEGSLGILVPGDWEGMGDTTYRFQTAVTSTEDPANPKASNTESGALTVVATLESMTLYIGREIDELIALITAAKDEGVNTGGLQPILLHPAKMNNDRALDYLRTGNPEAAQRTHETNIHILEAFLHALRGSGNSLPPDMAADWRARAEAIVGDQGRASTATFAEASCQASDLILTGDHNNGPQTFRACSSIAWGPGSFSDVTGIAPTHVLVDGFASNGDSAWLNGGR